LRDVAGFFCPLHKFDLNFTKSTMKNANKVSRSFQHMILLCGCLLIYYSVSARQHKPTESGYIAQKTQGIDSDYVLIFNSYSESAP